MDCVIKPCTTAGTVCLPDDKSETHRALILASLSGGTVRYRQLCDDAVKTLQGLFALGAKAVFGEHSVTFIQPPIRDTHVRCVIDCGASASTFRFFLPLALFLHRTVRFTGTDRLLQRVCGDAIVLCRFVGAAYRIERDAFVLLDGVLPAGTYSLPDLSSGQVLSGLLMVLPRTNGSSFVVTNKAVSPGYIHMTAHMVVQAGGLLERQSEGYRIDGYHDQSVDFTVHGDASAAVWFYLLNWLGGHITPEHAVRDDHPDRAFTNALQQLMNGQPVDVRNFPDSAPALFAAAVKVGGCFVGVDVLTRKESDRLNGMRRILDAFGVPTEATENGLSVIRSDLTMPTHPVETLNDHRLVMAASCLATVCGATVRDAGSVSKSMPSFWKCLHDVGVDYSVVK